MGVSHDLLQEKTAVCEEVAKEMVKGAIDTLRVDYALVAVCEEVAKEMVRGAIDTLRVDYALVATGIAGPGGGTPEIPVGTIWLGYGSKDDIRTYKLTEDFGRDINLSIATNQGLRLLLDFLKEHASELPKQVALIA